MFAPVEGDAPDAGWEQRPGLPLEPVRLVWALRRRVRLIALAVLVSIPVGLVAAYFLAPREFVAQSVLVWEPVARSSTPARELQTLTSSVKLPGNLAQVRERLKLTSTLEDVGARIRVGVVSNESNVLTISGSGASSEEAAHFTQAVTDVFLDARVRIARTRMEERLKALKEEVEQTHKQLVSARERYDGFRAQHHVVDFSLDRKTAIEQLALLRSEVTKSRVEADSTSAKANLLRSAVQKAPAQLVLTENQVQADRQKLAELSAQLTARRASLSQEHPEVRGLQASVEALERTPADAYTVTGRQVGANPEFLVLQEQLTRTSIDGEAAQKKWQSYSKMETALSERVLQLTALEGEANLLLADVQLAEERLGKLKVEQNELEAGVRQPSSELRVLNSPVPPPFPSQSSRRKVALAFPVLAGLFAMLFAAGQELRGFRLRTPSEIAFWAKAPVLASSSWPQAPEELRNLCLELASRGEHAQGTTLVLPLEPARNASAAEFVEALRARMPSLRLWDETDRVQALRRASRESARVLVLVEAGAHAALELAGLRRLLGRDDGIGLVVLGLGPELALLRDRVGDDSDFWGPSLSPVRGVVKESYPLDSEQRVGGRR
ncbi:GumC family protein [Cystobacter ferrugineus]|uniref:Polysaccharide chain length determinant N-terminal domain-containing protein n=1 Tax=Cystobacter ferrugineus TaxID=83449 RepID=A0A1L9BCY1_9BACT|nr:hypothetical protein [Cystobacter ferrugineus]OJH40109.1 hypothetical protein BON30_13700 [Cystobacter ferrugineus]